MSDIGSADLQNIATEGLASQTDQSAGPNVLPPFSGTLSGDEGLKVSNQNFKLLIEKTFNIKITLQSQVQRNSTQHFLGHLAANANLASTLGSFFKGKIVTPLSQLISTPPFPTPHVLAQFAFKAYTDYKAGETDAEYEKRLELPDGWKLLTTASNSSTTNGYFGAAYWHLEHQQVVIAHRGTDPTKFGPLWTDVVGVVFKHHVSQMCSANTFSHKVFEVLQEVSRKKGVSFQLFFTGHSLGGWLAQITTFTIKYLKRDGNVFLKSDNDQDFFHPHTVVFDSPGCKDMLSQLTDKFDVRMDGRSIEIEHLDITSYLSAPNRINTCNTHVGTVYRIFTDLSRVGWHKKHTPLYNLETHSMKKIVEAFCADTGQVQKDEQGLLKVKVVIDWPVSTGLLGGEEYNNFFEWAKHLNNYHPDVTDEILKLKDYHLLRYQTKIYNERVSSLSVFCQQERLFLESYVWLRQLAEFFKPKELFTVMENIQAQEQAEKMLQNFEIEKDKIRCADGSALQALIPYVKRLLQLFPQIKQITKHALSADEVRSRVYQIETKRYVERIGQSPLQFKAEALSLGDIITSGHVQVLQVKMVDGDERTGLIKVYQCLQNTGCLIEGQYTVLTLDRLLLVNHLMDFSTLMLSTGKQHLLLMACDTNQPLDKEAEDIFRNILKTIKQKPNIKIVLTTRSDGTTLPSLQQICREIFGEGFVTRDEHLTWNDITTESREKILRKRVSFQGIGIALNELIFADSPLTKLLTLSALVEGHYLQIGKPVPIPDTYNEGYYIGRTLRQNRAIKQDIFIDERKKEFRDSIARTEQEFNEIYQENPKRNVHWLEEDKSGKLIWQQSQGSLETLRKYIDTDSSHTYTADDIDMLLDQARHQRVIMISDTAGMGKSTVLTHLSKQIRQKFPAKWVVRVDLNNHTDALKELEREQIDKEKAIEFVLDKVLKLKASFELELFKQCCEQKQKLRIIIMLDGFDEICPFYKETVLDLLQALRQTAVEQLWVTTRPHLREELEDKLQQLSYTLEPFSEEDQVEFLTKFWSHEAWFTEPESKGEEMDQNKLQTYANCIIKELAKSVSDKERKFTGIPLQTRMLAEAFDEEVKTFYRSKKSKPEISFKLDLLGLYERFIDRKYDIYQEEKFQITLSKVTAQERKIRDLKSMRVDHQLLALEVLFTEEKVALFQNNGERSFSSEELTRIGIVQINHDGKPHFTHRTFAEYYVADCLVNSLSEGNKPSQQVLNFILKDISLEGDYRVIRAFMDDMLSRCKPTKEVLKEYGHEIYGMGEFVKEIFKTAVIEGNAFIAGILLDCMQAENHTDTVNEMLLANYSTRSTAWHNTIFMNNIHVLEKLWEWAKENLETEEINYKLLLATDFEGRTVWHVAAEWEKPEIFQKVWEKAKEELTTEEIKNNLLLATDNRGRTIWHVAAEWGTTYILETVLEWAKERLTTEEINNKLLLATDGKGRTVWHVAAEYGKTEILQKIWDLAEERLTREEMNNKLLLAANKKGSTVWHVAAKKITPEIYEKLWDWAKEKLTTEEIKNKLLLATDQKGRNAWHVAAKQGKPEILQKLWEWAKEKLTSEEINNELLLATDNEGKTVWHVAAEWGKQEILQKVWDCAKEKLTSEDINNVLLLNTDFEGRTVWYLAAERGKPEILQKVWEWAKEELTTEEIKNKLLLASDKKGSTVWHVAAKCGKTKILQKVWEWAKEKLTAEEIKNKLLLATDNKGSTVWHVAAERGKPEILQNIWDWAKGKLTTEEVKNKLLLAPDGEGSTMWHLAAKWGKPEILQKLWDWAKEKLTTEEIYNMLLLATDGEGQTIWHLAAKWEKSEIFQKIWDWTKEKLTTEELNNKLLLATDKKGSTVLHIAAKCRKPEILQKVWEWAEENLTTEEIINNLLFATDCEGKTVWHVAARKGSKIISQKLLEWTKEKLKTDEIYNKLLLTTDNRGRTVWHVAAGWGGPEILEKLWEWAKHKLTREEIINKLFLATDKKGRNIWHLAAKYMKPDILENLLDLAEDLRTEEMYDKLLLATDNKGRTICHFASEEYNLKSLDNIWECASKRLKTEDIYNKLLLAADGEGHTVLHVAAMWGSPELFQKVLQWAENARITEEMYNKFLLATDSNGRTAWQLATEIHGVEILEKLRRGPK